MCVNTVLAGFFSTSLNICDMCVNTVFTKQVVWKYMIRVGHNDFSYSKFVEEGTLRSVILAFLIYVVGLMAPYTATTGT